MKKVYIDKQGYYVTTDLSTENDANELVEAEMPDEFLLRSSYRLVNNVWTESTEIPDRLKKAAVIIFKTRKWTEIKQARSNAEFGGFTWDGSQFDSDAISQQRISGAVQLAMINPNYTVEWTLSNNDSRILSAQDVIAVGISLGNHVNFQHEKARLLREQINSATTVEQINAVVW